MRQTGFLLALLLIVQTVFASFPQPAPDSTQSSLSSVQPTVFLSGSTDDKGHQSLAQAHLAFLQKLEFKWLYRQLNKPAHKHGKSDWSSSVGGFLLGLCLGPIGWGITRFTHNDALRQGANLGFRIFLIILGVYIALVLAFLFIFFSLGVL